jgi:hypothetical protein
MRSVPLPDNVARIEQTELPVFSQDWWISIVRGSSEYSESRVVREDVVVGRLPYILSRSRLGLVRGKNPHWSHLGGPILDQGLSRAEKADVIQSLIKQLPRGASFSFICDSGLSYGDLVRQAFEKAGFERSTEITYVRFPSDGEVLSTRKRKHKAHFRRAAKALDCVDISATEFVDFFASNLKARGEKSYSPLSTMKSLIEEAVARGQARAIAAKQKSVTSKNRDCPELLDAAIVFVWDEIRCYYWLSTRRMPSEGQSNPKPHPDAIKLLVVKAMAEAEARDLIFDADGVSTPGTEYLYRNMFGLREQRRDVFRRATAFERFYQKCWPRLKVLIPTYSGAAVLGNIAADLLLS